LFHALYARDRRDRPVELQRVHFTVTALEVSHMMNPAFFILIAEQRLQSCPVFRDGFVGHV
jgi:hypothetical protein